MSALASQWCVKATRIRSAPAARLEHRGHFSLADAEQPERVAYELVTQLPVRDDDPQRTKRLKLGLLGLRVGARHDLEARVPVARVGHGLPGGERVGDGDDQGVG